MDTETAKALVHAALPRVIITVARAYGLVLEELDSFAKHPTTKLIAALPFIAGCRFPERIALSHLATYVIAERSDVFDHQPLDDAPWYYRLERISHFDSGDPKIIERGMSLLKLQMVCGYERSADRDAIEGTYNPITFGSWTKKNVLDMKKACYDFIESTPSSTMDEIMGPNEAEVCSWVWEKE